MKKKTKKSGTEAEAGALLNELSDIVPEKLQPQTDEPGASNEPPAPATEAAQTDEPGASVSSPEPDAFTDADVQGEPIPDDYLDDEDEDEGEADPVFSDKDVQDFERLDAEVTQGKRQTFERLVEIRRRRLYKIPRDENGNKLYPKFDAYVGERHGHDRTWVTKGFNWLKVLKACEKLGIKTVIGLKASQALVAWKVKKAGGLRAIFAEAQQENLKLDYENLTLIVKRRENFFGDNAWQKPAAPTYQEYRLDLETVAVLGAEGKYRLVGDAKKLPGLLSENLVKLCREKREIPQAEELVATFTGDALKGVVDKLSDLAKSINDMEAKLSLYQTRKKEVEALSNAENIRKLKAERDALRIELEAAGMFNKKKKADNKEGEPGEKKEGEPAAGEKPSLSVVTADNKRTWGVTVQISGLLETTEATEADIDNATLIGLPNFLELKNASGAVIGKLTELDVESIVADEPEDDEDYDE